MVGAAGVIGGKAIISADYEYRGSNMQLSDVNNNEYVDVSDEIKTYYKGVNIFRVGAEYRVTPQLSLRAGYSYESSPVKQWVANDGERHTVCRHNTFLFIQQGYTIYCGRSWLSCRTFLR